MGENTEILLEIRDLLRLMAEPALAKRDERLRASLHKIVGKSKQRAEAAVLMDGTRSQSDIRKQCGIDDGNLSRLVKSLREAELIEVDERNPKIVFPIPSDLKSNMGGD
jgi:DNA-binding MarR family transcriptional regulator